MTGSSLPVKARYRVQRISLLSALKVGLIVGWLLALVPALFLAWLITRFLVRVYGAVSRIQPIDIDVLGRNLAHIDPIALVGQSENVRLLGDLAASPTATTLMITVVLTLLGAFLGLVAMLMFGAGYNLLAKVAGGLEVELQPAPAVLPAPSRPPELPPST
jgi:hypothetical protein